MHLPTPFTPVDLTAMALSFLTWIGDMPIPVEPHEAWGFTPVEKSFLALLLTLASLETLPDLKKALPNLPSKIFADLLLPLVLATQVPDHALNLNRQSIGSESHIKTSSALASIAGGSRLG